MSGDPSERTILDRRCARCGNLIPATSSIEEVAEALRRMSKEEQTLTLIKASYDDPIRIARYVR